MTVVIEGAGPSGPYPDKWDADTMRGPAEIARACGVGTGTVQQWRSRQRRREAAPVTFPAPAGFAVLFGRIVPYWTQAQVDVMATQYREHTSNTPNPRYLNPTPAREVRLRGPQGLGMTSGYRRESA